MVLTEFISIIENFRKLGYKTGVTSVIKKAQKSLGIDEPDARSTLDHKKLDDEDSISS